MVMNHQAASSTECPTVNSPWLRWIVALCGPERGRQRLGRGLLEHDGAAALLAHRVVLVEDAGVLRDRVERAPERRPRLAVDRVGVGGGDDVGPRRVHGGVDGEGSRVDRTVALDDLAGVADEDQVRDPDVAEAHAEGVHPEVVGQFGVARRDVPGHALGEPEATEEPQRAGQLLLAVQALLLHGGERRRGRQRACGCLRGSRLRFWLSRACAMTPNYRLPMAYPTAATRDIAAPAEKVWALVARPAPDGGVVARERRRQVGQGRHRTRPRRRLQGHQQERAPALVDHGHRRRLRARARCSSSR